MALISNDTSPPNNPLTDKPLRRLFRLLALDKKDIFYIYLYAIFEGLIGLSIPLGVQVIINLVAAGQSSTSWFVLTLIIAVATAIVGTMKLMEIIIAETLQERIFTRSAFEMAYRIPRLKTEGLQDQYAPELANRFFDTLSVQKGLPKLIIDLSASSLQIFFGFVLLALYHPFFVAFGVVLLAIAAVVIWATSARGLKTSLIESKYKYKVAYWLEELGRTMNSFKLAGRTQYPLERTDELVQGYLSYRKKHFSILRIQIISMVSIKAIATAALLLIGGLLVINNEINIGQFVASEIVIIIVLNSLEKMMLSMETVFDVLTSVEKIGAVTDLPLESEEGIDFSEVLRPEGMEIKIHNLSYQPEGCNLPILNNIHLDINAGERICILGTNASGKTTLLRIIMGIYEQFSGSIAYNRIPRHNIKVNSLRSYMGDFVTEEHLFHGTLLQNITMGLRNVVISDVMRTCEAVGLMEYIETLPLGLDTMISSDGDGLPTSVVKKIILARCVVDTPKLVVVDTIVSGMEKRDSARFIQLLTNKENPWTLVAVTRNRQFAKAADRIVVLDKGQIVHQGDYASLATLPCYDALFDEV